MEVMMGPTFSIDVSVPAEFARDCSLPPPSSTEITPSSAGGGGGSSSATGVLGQSGSGIWSGQTAEYSSESSSSIGSPGDSEDEEIDDGEDDAVSSNEHSLRGLGSLSSLEDSLPIKRGLSIHFKGKSKSFGNLADISCVKEVEKQENPLNKRRRLQICNKWSRRSFYAWQNPKSMPLLPVNEDDDEDEEDLKPGFDERKSPVSSSSDEEGARKSSFRNRGFKSRSCFALSNLQEEEDD